MPSSFSRFLDESELSDVRAAYLESLAALEQDSGTQDDPVPPAGHDDEQRSAGPA